MFNEQNSVERPIPPAPFPERKGGVSPSLPAFRGEKGPGEERGPCVQQTDFHEKFLPSFL
jgi:hypothetical protein